MATWIYFASGARADMESTAKLALERNVVWRSARNENGNLIANVRNLQPGDKLLLAYRGSRPLVVVATARIAEPIHPASGARAIDRIEGADAQPLLDAGYPPAADGVFVEVIRLENVIKRGGELRGRYLGQNAIRTLEPADEDWRAAPAESARPTQSPPARRERADARLKHAKTPAVVAVEPESIRRSSDAKTLFDAYVMVDWSSNSTPIRGENSIWIGWRERGGRDFEEGRENPSTRSEAIQRVRHLLADRFAGKRVLLGFDFAFGYPKGFAKALGLEVGDKPPWRAIFDEFAAGARDDIDGRPNRHNRDEFADQCNARIKGNGPGPFWGCPQSFRGSRLRMRKEGTYPYAGLEEFRATELRARTPKVRPQSVWKLCLNGAVGGQTIMGIKRLAELRFESEKKLMDRLAIWPFETGWSVPDRPDQVVIAEIFPSVIPLDDDLRGSTRDEIQVRTCARHAAKLDAAGDLRACFGPPPGLDDEALKTAAEKEGWILFVR